MSEESVSISIPKTINAGEDSEIDDTWSSMMMTAKIETWLDLRDNALSPVEAVSALTDPLFLKSLYAGVPCGAISCVIVSQEVANDILTGKLIIPDNKFRVITPDATPHDENKIKLIECKTNSVDGDKEIGSLFSTKSISKSPMEALGCVAERRKWALIDKGVPRFDAKDDSKRRNEAIKGLTDFLSSSNLSSEWNSNISTEKELKVDNASGGLAVIASDPFEVFHITTALLKMVETSLCTFANSESEILVQSSASASSSPAIKVALVLPFDIESWKSAGVFFGW